MLVMVAGILELEAAAWLLTAMLGSYPIPIPANSGASGMFSNAATVKSQLNPLSTLCLFVASKATRGSGVLSPTADPVHTI